MDTNEYLPMFLAETEEHLQSLNLAVVRVEEIPDDRETVEQIFRIAHSMKGMSATMGFEKMAALTHAMEDVFELLRQRTGPLAREAVDTLLACLDALSGAVAAIATEGVERLEPEALIARLRGLVRPRTAAQEAARRGTTADALLARAKGRPLTKVQITLAEDVSMPAVRAFMALGVLGEVAGAELVGSVPDEGTVESFEGRAIEAWLAGSPDREALETALRAVAEVSAVDVGEPQAPERAAPPRPREPDAAARPRRATVRVDAERLDSLMHHMGELVVQRTLVESLVATTSVPGLSEAMGDLTRASQALQTMVMQVRMVPVEAVFLRFPRLVRDLSSRLGKPVELRLVGGDTELDRTVVDALGDPLVHLVRNSLDHGLEPADERRAAGKPDTGVLEISARHAGGNVVIGVRDDGRGIDPARIAAVAVDRGLISAEQASTVDMPRAIELLFSPGFSTAQSTSDISGRGVGMDAVRAAVRELGGDVAMTSELGQGTTATIRLPLTLAIVVSLLVEVAGRPIAIPLERVERTVSLAGHRVRSAAGRQMLMLDDGILPIVDAADVLEGADGSDGAFAVLVRSGDRRVGLRVGRLVGQRELVTRPLPTGMGERAAISAGAVLADGRIALIVDCDELAAMTETDWAPVAAAV